MGNTRYKDFLREEVKRLEQKLERIDNLTERHNTRKQIEILKNRINKDVRMGEFGVEI